MQRLLIVSGRSGTGKTSAIHILEDLGYLCIDNLPLSLIPDVVERLHVANHVHKLALGVDVRNPSEDLRQFDDVQKQVNTIITPEVLFLTAQDEKLIARFSSTRRKHPLMGARNFGFRSLEEALLTEKKLLEPIADLATLTIDTSNLNIHELKERIKLKVGQGDELLVLFQSFGFKYGVPLDADYVFDVRMLPNPHWQVGLREQTGQDAAVISFLEQDVDVVNMLTDLKTFIGNWLPSFQATNRHTLTVAIGCTGGKHRSVYMAESLAAHFAGDWQTQVLHREIKHWVG